MEGTSENFNTKSLTMSFLFAFEMIFNSITCDCISKLLSCFIFSLSAKYFLSFSSFAILRLSSLAFSSSFLLLYLFFLLFSLSTKHLKLFFFSLLFKLSKLLMFSLLSLIFFSLSLFAQEHV